MGKSIPTLPKDQVFPTALQLLGKVSIIKQKLQAFYSELEEAYPKPLYWERVSPTSDDIVSTAPEDSEFTFPPALWFHDLETASILTLYWAILAMVSITETAGVARSRCETRADHTSHRFRSGPASRISIPSSTSMVSPTFSMLQWVNQASSHLSQCNFC